MLTQLFQKSQEPSIIVVDIIPYHNVLVEKPPTRSQRKVEIFVWLQEKEIPFPVGYFKGKLLKLSTASVCCRKI
jgi:hypothetical protein